VTSSRPILHLVTNLELGGAQLSVSEICMRLRARGLDIHLAYSSRGGRMRDGHAILRRRIERSGVALHDLAMMRHAIHPVADAASAVQIYALLRRLRPWIVHTHMSKAGILGRLVAARAGVPHVLHTVRGWSFYAARSGMAGRLAVAAERLAARATTQAFAVSHSLARDGARRGVVVGDGYRIVRSGIDVARFADAARQRQALRGRLGIAEHAAVVGFVSAFTRAKGALDVPAVVREVAGRRGDVVLVVAGDGPLRAQFAAACRRAGIADRVRDTGQEPDIHRVMAVLDVLLIASRWEGVPRVAVEALAAGVPVVATDVGGIREVIEPGISGQLVPAGDVPQLARAILAVLGDPALRARLEAAAARVLAEHELEAVVAQHEAVYRGLLDPGGGPGGAR
jgi:glycosyltransferase involved in cell wall biosynthesis